MAKWSWIVKTAQPSASGFLRFAQNRRFPSREGLTAKAPNLLMSAGLWPPLTSAAFQAAASSTLLCLWVFGVNFSFASSLFLVVPCNQNVPARFLPAFLYLLHFERLD